MKFIHLGAGLSLLLLASCGREITPHDVKLIGVGSNPDEIGPAPTAYGGVIQYNHVDIAGGGLPLGVMGLRGYTEITSDMLGMAPPFQAVFGLTYLFDRPLRGANNLSLILPHPPNKRGTCYTQIEPQGAFDSSFNTVDVGDYIDLRRAEDDRQVVRFARIPRDYPPEASRLSTYYQVLESFSPSDRTHLVPGDSNDPRDMVEVAYRHANFPYGEDVVVDFPGGWTTWDRPMASIPRPSRSVEATILTLPQPLGGVQIGWQGPRHEYNVGSRAWEKKDGSAHEVCFEFTARQDEPESAQDCESLTPYPTDQFSYRSYRGNMYTGPWEAEDGQVRFQWEPDESDDTLVFAIKFLAPLDTSAGDFLYRAKRYGGDQFRSAQVCETDVEYVLDEGRFKEDNGEFSAAVQGDPTGTIAQVVCSLDNNGEFILKQEMLDAAYAYARERNAGGAIFMLGRSSLVEASIPAVKDPYDQIHEVNPIKVQANTVRVGRFWWGGDHATGGEQ